MKYAASALALLALIIAAPVSAQVSSSAFRKVSENLQPVHPVAGEDFIGVMQAADEATLPRTNTSAFYLRLDPAVVQAHTFATVKLTTVDGYYDLEYVLDLSLFQSLKTPAYVKLSFVGAQHLNILENYNADTAVISAYVMDGSKIIWLLPSLTPSGSDSIRLYVNNDGTDLQVTSTASANLDDCSDAGDGPYVMFRKVCSVPSSAANIRIIRHAAKAIQPTIMGH